MIMKNTMLIKFILPVFAVGMLFVSSCKKNEAIIFDKTFTGVYFQQDSIYYSFGITPLNVKHYELDIPVSIMGEPEGTDRNFKVEVIADKTSAVAGIHYNLVKDFVIKKDSVNGTFSININREELGDKDFKIFFRMVEGNGFVPANEALKTMVVHFNNKVEQPKYWPQSQLGNWDPIIYMKYIEIFRTMEQKAPDTYAAIVKNFGEDMKNATGWPWDYNNSMSKYVLFPLYLYLTEDPEGKALGKIIPRPYGY